VAPAGRGSYRGVRWRHDRHKINYNSRTRTNGESNSRAGVNAFGALIAQGIFLKPASAQLRMAEHSQHRPS
jgi:hypothetical protein